MHKFYKEVSSLSVALPSPSDGATSAASVAVGPSSIGNQWVDVRHRFDELYPLQIVSQPGPSMPSYASAQPDDGSAMERKHEPSIVVSVLGYVMLANPRRVYSFFVESFLLAPQTNGYYVHNDVLRMVSPLPQQTSQHQQQPDAPSAAPAATPGFVPATAPQQRQPAQVASPMPQQRAPISQQSGTPADTTLHQQQPPQPQPHPQPQHQEYFQSYVAQQQALAMPMQHQQAQAHSQQQPVIGTNQGQQHLAVSQPVEAASQQKQQQQQEQQQQLGELQEADAASNERQVAQHAVSQQAASQQVAQASVSQQPPPRGATPSEKNNEPTSTEESRKSLEDSAGAQLSSSNANKAVPINPPGRTAASNAAQPSAATNLSAEQASTRNGQSDEDVKRHRRDEAEMDAKETRVATSETGAHKQESQSQQSQQKSSETSSTQQTYASKLQQPGSFIASAAATAHPSNQQAQADQQTKAAGVSKAATHTAPATTSASTATRENGHEHPSTKANVPVEATHVQVPKQRRSQTTEQYGRKSSITNQQKYKLKLQPDDTGEFYTNSLFIKSIPSDTQKWELQQVFSKYGELLNDYFEGVQICTRKQSDANDPNFAFVNFKEDESAQRALSSKVYLREDDQEPLSVHQRHENGDKSAKPQSGQQRPGGGRLQRQNSRGKGRGGGFANVVTTVPARDPASAASGQVEASNDASSSGMDSAATGNGAAAEAEDEEDKQPPQNQQRQQQQQQHRPPSSSNSESMQTGRSGRGGKLGGAFASSSGAGLQWVATSSAPGASASNPAPAQAGGRKPQSASSGRKGRSGGRGAQHQQDSQRAGTAANGSTTTGT